MGKTDLYLYLISHNRKDIKTHTYIGCVEDFVNRLNQHNGIVTGGPRRQGSRWVGSLLFIVFQRQIGFKR